MSVGCVFSRGERKESIARMARPRHNQCTIGGLFTSRDPARSKIETQPVSLLYQQIRLLIIDHRKVLIFLVSYHDYLRFVFGRMAIIRSLSPSFSLFPRPLLRKTTTKSYGNSPRQDSVGFEAAPWLLTPQRPPMLTSLDQFSSVPTLVTQYLPLRSCSPAFPLRPWRAAEWR